MKGLTQTCCTQFWMQSASLLQRQLLAAAVAAAMSVTAVAQMCRGVMQLLLPHLLHPLASGYPTNGLGERAWLAWQLPELPPQGVPMALEAGRHHLLIKPIQHGMPRGRPAVAAAVVEAGVVEAVAWQVAVQPCLMGQQQPVPNLPG